MTIQDIHQAIKLELDKSTIASYDDFTIDEIDYFVNKSYTAVTNRKFTGHNVLEAGFEENLKRLSDLQELIKTEWISGSKASDGVKNQYLILIPDTLRVMYPLPSGIVRFNTNDGSVIRPTKIVNHIVINNFRATDNNSPWIPEPVITISDNTVNVFADPVEMLSYSDDLIDFQIMYLQRPERLQSYVTVSGQRVPNTYDDDTRIPVVSEQVQLEIIIQTVTYLLDNIESQRIQTYPEVNSTIE